MRNTVGGTKLKAKDSGQVKYNTTDKWLLGEGVLKMNPKDLEKISHEVMRTAEGLTQAAGMLRNFSEDFIKAMDKMLEYRYQQIQNSAPILSKSKQEQPQDAPKLEQSGIEQENNQDLPRRFGPPAA